jgi:hypothetical protein
MRELVGFFNDQMEYFYIKFRSKVIQYNQGRAVPVMGTVRITFSKKAVFNL